MPEAIWAQWLLVAVILNGALLLYAYFGFPLLMAWVARRPRQGISKSAKPKSISMIIAAYNEELLIREKINNALAVDYADFEIIVASDGSTDRTVEIAREFASVRVLAFEKRRGKTSVLNDAVKIAKGELICLCDANVMLHSDSLWRLESHFTNPGVGGVTGDVRLQSHQTSFGYAESLYYRLERSIQLGESNLGSVIGVDGGLYLIRRKLFTQLPADTVLDDFSVSMSILKSGMKLLYEPTAIADENATESALSEFKRRVRIGIGATQVLQRGCFPGITQPKRLFLFVSHKLLRWISPWLLLGLLVGLAISSFAGLFALAILIPCLILLGLATTGAIFPITRSQSWISVPFYFAISEIAIGMGTLKGLLFKSSGTWNRTARQRLTSEPDRVTPEA